MKNVIVVFQVFINPVDVSLSFNLHTFTLCTSFCSLCSCVLCISWACINDSPFMQRIKLILVNTAILVIILITVALIKFFFYFHWRRLWQKAVWWLCLYFKTSIIWRVTKKLTRGCRILFGGWAVATFDNVASSCGSMVQQCVMWNYEKCCKCNKPGIIKKLNCCISMVSMLNFEVNFLFVNVLI